MLLTFLHIIPFLFSAPDDLSVSDDMEKGKINSIKIEGVKGKGDYDLSDNKWDLSNSTAAGPYTVSFAGDEGKVEGKRALTGVANDNKVLMMIPQELGDGAKVKINFTPAGGNATEASFPLGGTTWDPGSHITYVLSTTKLLNLNMGTITYPDGWKSVNDNAVHKIKSSYTYTDTDGEAIGMYVVDKYNKVIVENLKFTYNGSQWTVEPGKEFKGSPQYNYFVYYPYQEGGLPGAPAKNASNIDVTSAASFFDKAIKVWCNKFDTSRGQTIDQSDIAKMNSFDLQIGKADGLGESATTIDFNSMKHTMGLAEITLGAKTLDNNYYLSNYPSYTWKNGTTTFHAYAGISGHSLYKVADYRYVALVKPDVTTDFSCSSSTDPDSWTGNVSVKPAANCVDRVTATSMRTSWPDIPYKMDVGDIYYRDGAITKPEDEDISAARANGKTPIGVIGYLGSDYWTEKGVSGKGGHALVMCLKTIGSTGSTKAAREDFNNHKSIDRPIVKAYMGTGYAWYSPNSDSDTGRRPFVDRKDLIVDSNNQTYGSGYTDTNFLIKKWGSDAAAAYQAKNYSTLPANSSKCTGWFLPSAGQYYAVMSQLGGGMSSDWEIGTFFSNMNDVTTNINKMLEKVGDSNYTEFFEDIPTWAWSSSEFSSAYAVGFDSGVDDRMGSGSVRFGTNHKTDQLPVRPFLAF